MRSTPIPTPLVGGMPIDSAWQSLELTVDKVLPAVVGA